MNRTEQDLRDALGELDRRAVEHGAPSTERLLDRTAVVPLSHTRHRAGQHLGSGRTRWLPPLAAAAVVAAAGVTAAVLAAGNGGPAHHRSPQAGGNPAVTTRPVPISSSTPTSVKGTRVVAAGYLEFAARKLDAMPPTPVPPQDEYYYRRTTDATTWTSVSGRKHGGGHSSGGLPANIPGCRNGHYVGGGTSGTCTLNDVPHYRADAPTTPSDWNAYLENIAPGSRAGHAQGKIAVQVLHEDLISSKASAALLRYLESCPGLHLVKTEPVDGETLAGVTCPSMSYGSYGLAFDASSHAFVGFVPVDYETGKQSDAAEIVQRTAIVKAVGDKP